MAGSDVAKGRAAGTAPRLGVWVYGIGIVAYVGLLGVTILTSHASLQSFGFVLLVLGGAVLVRLMLAEFRGRLPHSVLLAGVTVYLIIGLLLMFKRGGFVEVDNFILLLLAAAIILGQLVSFIRDWAPFMLILFGWQMLRGFADNYGQSLGIRVHDADLVRTEKWLFRGRIPTVELQRRFYVPGQIHWYDIVATSFWAFHFALPLLVGFLLWYSRRDLYWRFITGLLLLSFAGFATYILYPAAPPWLSSYWHTIPQHVYLIRDEVLKQIRLDVNVSELVKRANPNPIAAMPSLHSAYPTLIFWFLVAHYRRLAPLMLLYCLGIWTSVVYLGDHYIIDIIAGILYATITALVVEVVFNRYFSPDRSPQTEALRPEPAA